MSDLLIAASTSHNREGERAHSSSPTHKITIHVDGHTGKGEPHRRACQTLHAGDLEIHTR